MHHLELSSVQHRTICVSLSIKPVACQRVTDRGEMDADLMRASGLERDVEERAVARGGDRRDMRDAALAVVAHAKLDRADARDRGVDRLPLRERPFADGEVALPDFLFLELPRDADVHRRRFGEED